MILPRTSEGLYLLQRVRDEAHRFAITHHRSPAVQDAWSRACSTTCRASGRCAARACSGGSARCKKLRAATVEEIAEVPGIGPRTAEAIVAALAEQQGRPAVSVNTATGEIEES